MGIWGFSTTRIDVTVIFQLRNAKIPGVIDPFHTQHRLGLGQHFLYIVFADGIAEDNEHLIFADDTAGKEDGMADALSFVLIHKMRGQLRIFLADKVLDLFSQIAYNKDKFVDSGLH